MGAVFKIINLIVFPITLLTGILLTVSGLVSYINPAQNNWVPLLGLAFPFLFVLNILWLLYWWIQLKLKLIFPLIFMILNLTQASKYVQFSKKSTVVETELKVCTLNTQLFGGSSDTAEFWEVGEKIADLQPDILCLQEFYSIRRLDEKVKKLKQKGKFITYHFKRLVPDRNYGMVIFSKFPILKSGRISFNGNTGNMAMWADIDLGHDTVRVFNLHLQSIRFKHDDYEFISKDADGMDSRIAGSKNLLNRMRIAYEKRAIQTDTVVQYLDAWEGSKIVMGDLNDVPLSYTYRRILGEMRDAFRTKGTGFEKTYKGPFPNFRIDYIMYSPNLKCTSYSSDGTVPGDHKLLQASFAFPGAG